MTARILISRVDGPVCLWGVGSMLQAPRAEFDRFDIQVMQDVYVALSSALIP